MVSLMAGKMFFHVYGLKKLDTTRSISLMPMNGTITAQPIDQQGSSRSRALAPDGFICYALQGQRYQQE